MVMKDLLITFGDSWTFGEGSAYKDGMNQPQYEQIQHDPDLCWENGWRKRVVEHFDFDHINFAIGGSSNDKQFRVAKKFFTSKKFKEIYQQKQKIYVLWGTTSVNRYDFWVKDRYRYEHIFLKDINGDNVSPEQWGRDAQAIDYIAACLNKYSYCEPARVKELEIEFLHWNQYFKLLGIKNFWYDTFCSFNYSIKVSNFFDMNKNRRDLLSVIVDNHRKDHPSLRDIFPQDDFLYACKQEIINPYSYHPLTVGYELLGNHLIKKLQENI